MTQLEPVTDALLDQLRARLPRAAFAPPSDRYLTEPRGLWRGRAGAILAPGTAEEVADILRLAHAARVAVVPQGGGTGLVGGQLAEDLPDPIILTTERMNRVLSVHPAENVIEVQAGAILQEVRAAAAEAGRLFPLMLASEGSARIGGTLATNAGGMNVLRYGNARDLCLGVEAVLADGTRLHGLRRLRKDNTGYDLRNLMIGSEGTLGIITAAALRLFPAPARNETALLQVPDPAAALRLLQLAGAEAGELISIFELISRTGLEFIAETLPDRTLPVRDPGPWMVMLELGTPRAVDGAALMAHILEAGLADGCVTDGILAQSEAQRGALIAMREAIPEGNRRIGSIASHDISLPLSIIPEFIDRAGAALAALGPVRVNCFGHLGDGNLHYNVFPPRGETRADWAHLRAQVTRLVHDMVAEYGGSFSAEHGVGRLKTGELVRYGDPGRLEAMRRVKRALDPHGILNPGVIL